MDKTATEMMMELDERRRGNAEKILHNRMEWFTNKYQPEDRRQASEFHADLLMLIQAVHQDASRHTHKLLESSLNLLPGWPGYPAVDGYKKTAPPKEKE